MNAELHEHLMRVTVEAFKRETNKLKEEIACREERRVKTAHEWFAARAALASNGFEQTPTGEWKPPLGKRPDFEGQNLIAAAVVHVAAVRKVFDAADEYKTRPK